jgi:hypothetical protein
MFAQEKLSGSFAAAASILADNAEMFHSACVPAAPKIAGEFPVAPRPVHPASWRLWLSSYLKKNAVKYRVE